MPSKDKGNGTGEDSKSKKKLYSSPRKKTKKVKKGKK